MSQAGHEGLFVDETMRLAAEALAAVTGIQRLLDKKPRPLTVSDARKAIKLPREMERLFTEFLSTPRFGSQKVEIAQLDYFEILEQLTRVVTPEQHAALLTNFEDPQAGLAYTSVLDAGVAWLLTQLPRRSRPTLVGDVPVEPSKTEMADFARVWAVAEDPMVVIRDMSEGIMITQQVDAFRALFPTLYARSVLLLQGLLIDMRGKNETWEPPPEKTWQAFTYFGISPVDPELAAKLQDQAVRARQQGDAEQQSQGINIDLRGLDSSTPTQRLANE